MIMFNYLPTIGFTIILIVLLVNIEYRLSSRERFELKDTFSHDLGNIMQVINSASDLIDINTDLNEQAKEGLELIHSKCKEASKLIRQIRNL